MLTWMVAKRPHLDSGEAKWVLELELVQALVQERLRKVASNLLHAKQALMTVLTQVRVLLALALVLVLEHLFLRVLG